MITSKLVAKVKAPPKIDTDGANCFVLNNQHVYCYQEYNDKNFVLACDLFAKNLQLRKSTQQSPPVFVSQHVLVGNQLLYVFGGRSVGSNLTDTMMHVWHVNNNCDLVPWKEEQLVPEIMIPSERCSHCMVYRSRAHSIVLFGGFASTNVNDLWEYSIETNTWQEIQSKALPTPRYQAGMEYYEPLDCLFLVGGVCKVPDSPKLYKFSFVTMQWQVVDCEMPQCNPNTHSSYVCRAMIVNQHQLLVVGNEFDSYMYLYDIWQNKWFQITGIKVPHMGLNPICCYDHDKVIVFQNDTMYLYQLDMLVESKSVQHMKKVLLAKNNFCDVLVCF